MRGFQNNHARYEDLQVSGCSPNHLSVCFPSLSSAGETQPQRRRRSDWVGVLLRVCQRKKGDPLGRALGGKSQMERVLRLLVSRNESQWPSEKAKAVTEPKATVLLLRETQADGSVAFPHEHAWVSGDFWRVAVVPGHWSEAEMHWWARLYSAKWQYISTMVCATKHAARTFSLLRRNESTTV